MLWNYVEFIISGNSCEQLFLIELTIVGFPGCLTKSEPLEG